MEITSGDGKIILISNSYMEDDMVLFDVSIDAKLSAKISTSPGTLLILRTPLEGEEAIFWGIYNPLDNEFCDIDCSAATKICYLPDALILLDFSPEWEISISELIQMITTPDGSLKPSWCDPSVNSGGMENLNYILPNGEAYFWDKDNCPLIRIDYP